MADASKQPGSSESGDRKRPTLSSTPKPPPLPDGYRSGFRGRQRLPDRLPEKPRRVRGGLRLKRPEDDPGTWVTQRLTRVIEQAAAGGDLAEGIEYARQGQTKRMVVEDGRATAVVQGRRAKAYTTSVGLVPFTPEQKDKIVRAMSDQAKYAASLLGGELPRSIEDLFAPLGMKLFPAEPADLVVDCTCFEETKPWCKHSVCVTALLAERLGEQPLLVFSLRGFEAEELIRRLREQRTLGNHGPGPSPVYAPHPPADESAALGLLEEELGSFWRTRADLDELELPIVPPEVSHPLLRRLGPSPLEGRFPLVGLLATCYELISEHAISEAASAGEESENGDPADPGAGTPASD